jgi:hypothetical protein
MTLAIGRLPTLSKVMSSHRFATRRLRRSESPPLRALNTVFGEAFGDPETYEGEPPSDAYLERLLSKEHVIVLVARAREQVVGGLVAYELEKFERGASCASTTWRSMKSIAGRVSRPRSSAAGAR